MKRFLVLFFLSFTVFAQTHLGDGVYLLSDAADPASSVVKVSISEKQINDLVRKNYVNDDCDPSDINCDINELTYQKELKNITRELIYAKLNDDFDYIYYILNNDNSSVTSSLYLGFTGRMHPVRIVDKYIDLQYPNGGTIDFHEKWGSAEKLKGVFYLPMHNAIKNGPSLHEFAHQWGVGIVPELNGHWGASNAGGQLGGFKYLKEIGTNQFQGSMHTDFSSGFGSRGYSKNVYPYSDIELYLMGFKSAQDLRTGNFVLDIYLNNGSEPSVSDGKFSANQKKSYTIDDIMNQPRFGGKEREPNAANSPKKFKVLTVILSLPDTLGQNTYENRINNIVGDINWFGGKETPQNSDGLYNFYQATQGIGSLDVGGIKNSLRANIDYGRPDPNPRPEAGEKPKPADVSVPDIMVDLEIGYYDTTFIVTVKNSGGQSAHFNDITVSGDRPSVNKCGNWANAGAENSCWEFLIPSGLAKGHYEDIITVSFSQFGDIKAYLFVNVGKEFHGQGKDGSTSIIKKSENNKQFGIVFSENPAHGKVEISLKTPEKLKYADLTIYDMTGNAVCKGEKFFAPTEDAIVWDLRNSAGRIVANGTYLVIIEARAQNGNIYRYSAKLGVKR